jgi:hypothetical protein
MRWRSNWGDQRSDHHTSVAQAPLWQATPTIQLIYVATGWSERVAVLGRGQTAMESGFRRILARIPFAMVELHPDKGSEFFNQHLVRFWKTKPQAFSSRARGPLTNMRTGSSSRRIPA